MKNTQSRTRYFISVGGLYPFLRSIMLLIAWIAVASSATAQTIKVNGVVKDSNGETIIGASVVEENTTNCAVTDLEGRFSLNVAQGATLQISYIGYTTERQKAAPAMNIILQEDNTSLQKLLVVGYGTQKKVNLTGSVASVTPEAIENRPITQTSQALAGLTSGVTVSQSSGRPGGDQASIRIRGVGTFSGAGSDPLVLIDGLSGSINDVDPNNIANISILKDAASSAITVHVPPMESSLLKPARKE
jgi:hypothetical protein